MRKWPPNEGCLAIDNCKRWVIFISKLMLTHAASPQLPMIMIVSIASMLMTSYRKTPLYDARMKK